MSETYAFIDGAYFREVVNGYMQQLFAVDAEIDYWSLFKNLRNVASPLRRVFYYDCLDDLRKDKESTADFDARVQAQQATFSLIQSTDGFHVRFGSISGKGKKKRQKQVDVTLAVEALDHAFRKNMAELCLIAGDLDFLPLVDSLVKLGIYVKVMYEPRSAARELYAAADAAYPIRFTDVYNWSSEDFRKKHPIPQSVGNTLRPDGVTLGRGTAQSTTIELLDRNGMFSIYAPRWDHQSLEVNFRDRALLEKYFDITYGPIAWHQ